MKKQKEFLRACPKCGSEIKWHILKNKDGKGYHYYCEQCDEWYI